MTAQKRKWLIFISGLILLISYFHYNTPTSIWQFHLIFMELYFIPILLAAFQFGVKGGVRSAIVVTIFYLPHVMLQWGGLIETNLLRFMQIVLFNVIGYLTGLKAQGEQEKAEKYHQLALKLEKLNEKQKQQTEKMLELERELRAADRLATIGELTASLAHEVRNPLASIHGAVEIIRDLVPEKIKKSEFFDILFEETKRLNTVVESYLAFAKKQPHSVSRIDLKETVLTLIKMLESRARKNKIIIRAEFGEKPIIVHGDPYLLQQVLMNVLLNSVQAMTDGGNIILRIKKIRNFKDNGDLDDPKVLISIRDEGKGIPKEYLNKIFKPFFTTKKSGTGLGLAIVKRIADENGWKINIQSEINKGTTFELEIPIKNGKN
ncbi:MAG: sensor histidine kinase [Calditrichaeota bacterium]|nr:sensor histidine kinase [Calditrichota bacterium]